MRTPHLSLDTAIPVKSMPELMTKLRRVGGLLALFLLLVLAAVYWITQDMNAAIDNAALSKRAIKTAFEESTGRLYMVVIIAGAAMTPMFVVAALLVGRFVRYHFRELEMMNKRKTKFVSMVAHELRTPLNAIVGFSDLLAGGSHGKLNDGQADCVKEVRSGAAHLKRVINDILDMSRIEAGSVEINRIELKAGTVIEAAILAAAPLARARDIRLVAHGDLAAAFTGDAIRVKQILLNLLSNAVKFSPAGEPVDIGADASGNEVVMTVSDKGGGISREDQGRLFEEYGQLREAWNTMEGTGLGLAICRKLVELQGGRIWVESAPGEGSRFRFALPVVRPAADALVLAPSAAPGAGS
jgi:signal transduction histidine kinase